MNSEKISLKLKELRGNKTASEVANACGISVSALSMYETGRRIPRDEIKMSISKFYQKTVEEIFFDD